MKTVIVNVGGRAYTAEVIRQDGDILDVRCLGSGFSTAHNVLPEGVARDGETSYRPETLKDAPDPEPTKTSYPKGKPSIGNDPSK